MDFEIIFGYAILGLGAIITIILAIANRIQDNRIKREIDISRRYLAYINELEGWLLECPELVDYGLAKDINMLLKSENAIKVKEMRKRTQLLGDIYKC
jgi:hypothetical protein